MSVLTRYPVPQPGEVDKEKGARLFFRLEPTLVLDPVGEFLRPLRGLEVVEAGAVNDPRLYFRLGAVAAAAITRLLPAAVVKLSAQRVADRAFVHKQSRQARLPKSEM